MTGPDPELALDAAGWPVDMEAEERTGLAYLASGDLNFAATLLPEDPDA